MSSNVVTKLKFTIAENESPLVERYKNELKVGERKLTLPQFHKAIIEMMPVDQLVSCLVNDKMDDLQFYLSNSSGVTKSGEEFISLILEGMENLLSSEYDEHFQVSFNILFEQLERDQLSEARFKSIFLKWVKSITHVSDDAETYIEPLKFMLKIILRSSVERGELLKELQQLYAETLHHTKNDDLIEWVTNHLDFVPHDVLTQHLVKKEKSQKVLYNALAIPKNVAFMSNTNSGSVFFYDLPASRYFIKYQNTRYENVGHPRLLFAISFDGKNVTNVKLAALKGNKPLCAETPLYKYPFSNVFNDGRVCWHGYHDLPIDTIPNMFLSASNNSHLSNNAASMYSSLENNDYDENTLESLPLFLQDWF